MFSGVTSGVTSILDDEGTSVSIFTIAFTDTDTAIEDWHTVTMATDTYFDFTQTPNTAIGNEQGHQVDLILNEMLRF